MVDKPDYDDRKTMEDASLQGGLVVCTRWRLRARLSAGSGRVWEAENIDTHKRVAIKFLARPAAGDTGARRRFEREMRAINKVRSPYVLPILDHGHTESGLPFIVTELLKGKDVGRLLGQERVLGLIETGRILDQVCRGVSNIHAAGLAYGSLRPENVFLLAASDPQPSVRLLGFGVAAAPASEGTQLAADGTVRGVSAFVSPEQLKAQARVDSRTDIWALGVLAYRMLTGAWPFDVNNWVTLAQSIQTGTFTPVSVRRKDLPVELDGWFAQALQSDLAQRFATIEEARAAFERTALVYTAGMLAQPRPSLELRPEPSPSPSIIVHPTSSRSRSRAAWRVLGYSALAIGLGVLALRGPWSRWLGGVLALPSVLAGQFDSRPAPRALAARLPDPPAGAIAGVAPQPVAAGGVALMSAPSAAPPPQVAPEPAVKPRREPPPVRAAGQRVARTGDRGVDLLSQPPPEPRPRNVSAIVLLNDPSPDLPPPSHVYRGF